MRFKFSTLILFGLVLFNGSAVSALNVSPPAGKTGTLVTVQGVPPADLDPAIVFFAADGTGAAVPNAVRVGDRVSGVLGPALRNNTEVQVWSGRSVQLPKATVAGRNFTYLLRDASFFFASKREAQTGNFFINANAAATFAGNLRANGQVGVEVTFPEFPNDDPLSIRVDVIIDGQGGGDKGTPPQLNGGGTFNMLSIASFSLDIVPSSWALPLQAITPADVVDDVAAAINQNYGPMGWVATVQNSELWVGMVGAAQLDRGFINIQLNP